MTGGESYHRSTPERAQLSSREEEWKQTDDSRALREEEESSNSIQAQPHSSSPEGAGVVRGLSRSVRTAAQSVAKRSVAGRLPVSSSRSATRSVPRMMRGKLPARQVARVTDRLSTGLDVVSTAMEDAPKGGATAPPSRALRIASISWSLITNTVLGMAVFETYDVAISRFAPEDEASIKPTFTSPHQEEAEDTSVDKRLLLDHYDRATLPEHIVSGACAGTIHAIGSTLLDGLTGIAVRSYNMINEKRMQRGDVSVAATKAAPIFVSSGGLLPLVVHHATAHAVLFGTYEWSKRHLVDIANRNNANEHKGTKLSKNDEKPSLVDTISLGNRNEMIRGEGMFSKEDFTSSDEEESSSIQYNHVAAIGVAGGLAGVTQHVVSHFTETWLNIGNESVGWGDSVLLRKQLQKGSPSWTSSIRASLQQSVTVMLSTPPPTLRSALLAFPPSAIGFMAFEYGKDLFSSDNHAQQ